MAKSAYIHIPFCKSKCKYCSFVSYTNCSDFQMKEYIDCLLKDIKLHYKGEQLETIYIGGGTPSLLEIKDIKRLIECLNYSKDTEITIEINPETVDYNYILGIKEIGINRISVGIQSFDDHILKKIGRIHTAEKAKCTIVDIKKVGIDNISCDFIYGLPDQTLESFISDLKSAIELGVSHISLYGLKIEEGCHFYNYMPYNIPDDDMQADMYLAAIDTLKNTSFSQYEISNFCKDNKYSHHNMNYWNCNEYYGFGAAAHGYIDGIRYSNHSLLEEYKKNFYTKQTSKQLSEKEKLEESIFLGFRRSAGIDIEEINNKFLINFDKKYESIISKYLFSGHLEKTVRGYCLSSEGFLLSNIILSEFL